MVHLTNILPVPLRGIVYNPYAIHKIKLTKEDDQITMTWLNGVGMGSRSEEGNDKRKYAKTLARNWICALCRVMLIATAALAVYASGVSMSIPAAALAGAVISMPATLIAAGSYLSYTGITAIITAVSTNSFATLGTSLLMVAVGWVTLENNASIWLTSNSRAWDCGIAERMIVDKCADKFETTIAKAFANKTLSKNLEAL